VDHQEDGNNRRPSIPENTSNKDQKSAGRLSHSQQEENYQGAQFSEDEIQNLREIFDLFDKEKNGTIDAKDLHTIMSSLQRDPEEVKGLIGELIEGEETKIDFDGFVNLMEKVETNIAKNGGVPRPEDAARHMQEQVYPQQNNLSQGRGGIINIAADSKVLDFLRLLEEYRRKCEDEGNYAEARKARAKFDELLKKETARQRNNIRAA